MSPPSFTLNIHALLTLPYRLCNPPPAAGNVRSCKVTPLIKVSLDDVLNKRHLPPLTLKDFEEWLVYVEGCPQYLYFLLWLKEYEVRYAAWLADSGYASPPTPAKSLASTSSLGSTTPPDLTDSSIALIPPSAPLALFFTRAKQTFLDPEAPYALGPAALASLARAPSTHSLSPSIPYFATSPAPLLPEALSTHPHPHPRELAPLASHARIALKVRLERFATSACTNVGTRRAWCGVAGGVSIMLLLGVLPALVALFFVKERWWRVLGWGGCWLGGTVVLASFHGICMMIYIFGDLRQLRSFELARPPISPPRAIARARPRLHSYFTSSPDPSSAPNLDPDGKPSFPDRNLKVHIPTRHKVKEGSVSETSTGTPVVNLDPGLGACVLSEETTLGIHIGTEIRETDITQSSNRDEDTGEGGDDDDCEEEECAIEISPAYYPEGSGPAVEGDTERGARVTTTMLGSVRSGAGRVMEWMKRASGVGAGSGAVKSRAGTVSHVGTFGVKREAGSLSERGEVDTKAGRMVQSGGEFCEKGEVTEDERWGTTAEFITKEYDQGVGREVKDVEKTMAKKDPVQFDFDKLPTVISAVSPAIPSRPVSAAISPLPRAHSHTRSLSLPDIWYPHAPSPGPPPTQALPPLPLTPLITTSTPALALYAHPGAHILPPSGSAPSLPLPPFPAPPPAPERQWWDTCPRHPAVAASLSATRASSPHSSAIHSRPHSHAYPLPIDPRPLASHPDPLSPDTIAPASPFTTADAKDDGDSWRKRLALATRVPAFGPLTRVLSPVAARGQWEIVIRSAAVAAVLAWFFVGALVALPELGG